METSIFNFEDMNLKEQLLRGIYSYGFEKPSEIQLKSIVHVAAGKDIVAQSQSGTGKTGAFVIGMLQRINDKKPGCRAIILAPTRELASQICEVCKNIGYYMSVRPILCVGGQQEENCTKKILSTKGPYVCIGTSGKIIDLMNARILNPNDVEIIVVDEADEMLAKSMDKNKNNFQDQLKFIIQHVNTNTQICLFSATISNDTLKTTEQFLRDPMEILVKKEELTLEGIKQYYINVEKENYKLDTFCDLYDKICLGQSIVYVNSKKKLETLKNNLERRKFTISVIHSNMTASERTTVMSDFRKGKTRVLISTDLLSRGIDIQQVSIVINYDLPFDKSCYIHRIGRSGRFGRKGIAINFVTNNDAWIIGELQKFYLTQIDEMPYDMKEVFGSAIKN